MTDGRTAAVLTVGTEITTGLRLDTNTRDIAVALLKAGCTLLETVSMPDDVGSVAHAIERLTSLYDLVVVTGGLGPTHDDITRDAASEALSRPLVVDPETERSLAAWAVRQGSAEASAQVMRQALVLEDAVVLPATTGTAPGQVVATPSGGSLVLLPGPPHEMAPMLDRFLGDATPGSRPRELACTGINESDAQLATQRVLASHPGVTLALLARPADIRVVLLDDGAGPAGLDAAVRSVREALGDVCYSDDGSSLAEVVVRQAVARHLTVATAESCTGGLVGGALTEVPGSSAVYLGGATAYANDAKTSLLGVPAEVIEAHGAVSAEVAMGMAQGARQRLSSDLAVSVTGIAGPDGGSPEKPVGLVWFGVATPSDCTAVSRTLPGDRQGVRARATIAALDLLRHATREM